MGCTQAAAAALFFALCRCIPEITTADRSSGTTWVGETSDDWWVWTTKSQNERALSSKGR